MVGDTHNLLGGVQESQAYLYNILKSALYPAVIRICAKVSIPKCSTLLHMQ